MRKLIAKVGMAMGPVLRRQRQESRVLNCTALNFCATIGSFFKNIYDC